MDLKCYNFLSQEVFLTDSHPSLISVMNDNKIVIVFETIGCIKIYDLTVISEQNQPIITIPLIESNVRQLVHSEFGNYLALLADNQLDTNSKTVRVYCNYWIDGQPIRIRPNGSLTHSNDNQSEDHNIREPMTTEAIELTDISIRSDGQYINCCQSTANLIICCGFKVLLYSYQTIKTSNNRIKCDFIFLLDVRLEWFATKVSLVDRYIGLMSKTHFSLLRLNFDYDLNVDNNTDNGVGLEVKDVSEEVSNCIEWDFNDNSKTIRLPSMFDSPTKRHPMMTHCRQVVGPVDPSLCCKFGLHMNHSNIDSPICRASVDVLLCQYFESSEPLIDMKIISFNQTNSNSCDPLNALNVMKSGSKDTKNSDVLLTNQTKNDMIGSALLLLTNTHLYNYNIFNRIELKDKLSLTDKLRNYSVNKSDDTLHLLTEKGLQTYGLNFHSIFLNYKRLLPIIRLNFRTFLSIEYLLSTKNYILLVTELENSLRTIYSLKIPSIKEISCDINALISEDLHLKSDDKFNLQSFLNSILHFNCRLNPEIDSELNTIYEKSCVNLCNFLMDSKPTESKQLSLELIKSAKLEFSHLINYKLNFELIIEYIRKKLDSESELSLNVNECDSCRLKAFLNTLCAEDYTMFCRFCWTQLFPFDVRIIIISLLESVDSKHSYFHSITLSKLLLENNDMKSANNYIIELEDSVDLYKELTANYRLIFLNNSFVELFENSIPNIFYKFLLILVESVESIECIYELIESDYELRIGHNFLVMSYNRFRHLFTTKLLMSLIEANVKLLTNGGNELIYSPIESIERQSMDWIELLPPYHSVNECFCMKCNGITSDLYILLYSAINEDIIKNEINNLFNKIDANYEWLFTARLLSMVTIEAIELLLNDYPLIVFPYISHVCHSDTIVLKKVIHLIASKIDNIQELDKQSEIRIILSFTINQLAIHLAPEELIPLLPTEWKEFADSYVQKSIINMQSNILKQKIVDLGKELNDMFVS